MAEPLNNLRTAYHELARRVARALRTQLGDGQRLRSQRDEVLRFVADASVVSPRTRRKATATNERAQHMGDFPAGEFGTLRASADAMVAQLDTACHQSTDSPDGPALVVARRVHSGKRGRPRVHIEPAFLAEALTLRAVGGIAPIIACSARTIRRRALELGLVAPAPPVARVEALPNGGVTRTYNVRADVPPHPAISDAALDAMVLDVLTVFPAFGRSMLAGHLASQGLSIHRNALRAAYIRVHGSPVQWGNRVIERRGYNVAGANSLWHHDGQHGVSR